MDPMDHEADSGHNDEHNPGRADESGDQEMTPANTELRQRWTGPSISKLKGYNSKASINDSSNYQYRKDLGIDK